MIKELAQKYNATEKLIEMIHEAFCQTGDIELEWFMSQKMWDGASLGDWIRTAISFSQADLSELEALGITF